MRFKTSLNSDFTSPPESAWPRVWWHWMNGNVTPEGVKLDLEWMKRVGIAGVQNFDASLNTPLRVEKPLSYLTPEWQRTVRDTVAKADELGLEFTIASSAGWSESGGPWVQPQQAMKKLVWSETVVNGGTPVVVRLSQPPGTAGPFQSMPLASLGEGKIEHPQRPAYYADIAVMAYRVPASEAVQERLVPNVTSSSGAIDTGCLSDDNLATTLLLPIESKGETWIQFSYPQLQRVQAITSAVGYPTGTHPPFNSETVGWLEVSDDEQTFRRIAALPRNDALPQTVSFPPITSSLFRVVFKQPEPCLFAQLGYITAPAGYQIGQLVLHTGARVNRFEDKAGYSSRQITEADDTPNVASKDSVALSDIVNLTEYMQSDGSLRWMPPAGQWVVMRFGYSLTGRTNHPASAAGTGLEVDKLNAKHVKAYIDTYLYNYEEALGPALMGQRGLRYVLTDSYEAGAQNWTDDMLMHFEQRRGYSLLPWLPVLAGRVVESAAASDRMLWDFRKTLGELIAEAHYGQLSKSLHQRGLGRYGESHEVFRAFVGDGMEVKKTADVPMGAIWAARVPGFTQEHHDADIRESASVAHIYGQNLVAAESFTAFGNTYGFTPEMLKPLADRAMANGLNRFVIHTSVHQPDRKMGPGMGLGPFGQWFTRKEVWAEMAGAWLSYLARCSYLLQQGRFVADIAYLYGEDTNITSLFGASAPPIPDGYNFDFVNPDALLNELSIKDGSLATRAGMFYRVLALDATSTRRISVPLLRRLRDLVRAGAVLVGAIPVATPSLADDENEFEALVTELWGSTPDERTVGEGKVFGRLSLSDALSALRLSPDVEFLTDPTIELRFVHRTLFDAGDIYFVSNGNAHPLTTAASFRIAGRTPELWRADTGTISPVSYHIENGRTIVPLSLEAHDSVFIIFEQSTTIRSAAVPELTLEVLTTLDGPWDLSFPPDHGAPPQARFASLHSWTENADEGIKYFSGTATYSKTLSLQEEWLNDHTRLKLDLGEVQYLAEVFINGHPQGTLWKHPFIIDLTDAMQAGDNLLEIKVANLWPNRLIGDKQPGARKIAFAAYDPFKANSPLLPSGLFGPVTLMKSG